MGFLGRHATCFRMFGYIRGPRTVQAGHMSQTAAGGIGNLLASSEIASHSASPQGILVFFRDQVGQISTTAIHKWKNGVSFSLFNAGLRVLRASNCTRHVFPAKTLFLTSFLVSQEWYYRNHLFKKLVKRLDKILGCKYNMI